MSSHSYTITEVFDGLYISGYKAVTEQTIRLFNITYIVNLTATIPNTPKTVPGLTFLRVVIQDLPTWDIRPYLDMVSDRIEQVMSQGHRVLVHCVVGMSRSASFVIAFLVKHRGMTLREAYFFLKARRPVIHPNIGFFAQLIEFEINIRGEASVSMVPLASNPTVLIPDVYANESRGMLWFDSVVNEMMQ